MKRATLLAFLLALAFPAVAGEWEDSVKQAAKLHRKGQLKEAESILLKSLLKAEDLGETDPRLAYTLDYLGTLSMQMNDPSKAEPMLRRAVKAFEASGGPIHEDTLSSLARLADCLEARKNYKESEPLWRRLVEAKRGDAVQQSQDLNSLGVSLDAQGNQGEAEKLYRQALELRQAKLGNSAPELAELLNNLGRIYYMKGQWGEAEAFYRRSIAIDEKSADQAPLADDYARLAPVLRKAGRDAEAKELEDKAASIQAALAKPQPVAKAKSKAKKAK